MASRFSPGTLGHVIYDVGLTFEDLQNLSGLNHTTIMRWAEACQRGARVVMRSSREVVGKVFDEINLRDRERGGHGLYTPALFGLCWDYDEELRTSDEAVQAEIDRIHKKLDAAGSQRRQLAVFSTVGKSARTSVERVAFDLVWRRFVQDAFPYSPNAWRTPPTGVRFGEGR